MELAGIKIDGIPDGWEAVRYGMPKTGEYYLGTSDGLAVQKLHAGKVCLGNRMIVRRKPKCSVQVTWAGPQAEEPKYRKLLIGEQVMPGDTIETDSGYRLYAFQHYKDDSPKCQGDHPEVVYLRYPWTEEEYRKRQEEWIKFHDLKSGDLVKVCCVAERYQDGWQNSWVSEMTPYVGKTMRVVDIVKANSEGILLSGLSPDAGPFQFPFYVLQVLEKPKPEPKYRGFQNPREVLEWTQKHGKNVVSDTWWGDISWSRLSMGVLTINGMLTNNFSDCKSTKDGTPFGVLEEEHWGTVRRAESGDVFGIKE